MTGAVSTGGSFPPWRRRTGSDRRRVHRPGFSGHPGGLVDGG